MSQSEATPTGVSETNPTGASGTNPTGACGANSTGVSGTYIYGKSTIQGVETGQLPPTVDRAANEHNVRRTSDVMSGFHRLNQTSFNKVTIQYNCSV